MELSPPLKLDGVSSLSLEPIMLKATEEEIEEVREYFEWQAPDLEVTFLQKVYSEAVLNTRTLRRWHCQSRNLIRRDGFLGADIEQIILVCLRSAENRTDPSCNCN